MKYYFLSIFILCGCSSIKQANRNPAGNRDYLKPKISDCNGAITYFARKLHLDNDEISLNISDLFFAQRRKEFIHIFKDYDQFYLSKYLRIVSRKRGQSQTSNEVFTGFINDLRKASLINKDNTQEILSIINHDSLPPIIFDGNSFRVNLPETYDMKQRSIDILSNYLRGHSNISDEKIESILKSAQRLNLTESESIIISENINEIFNEENSHWFFEAMIYYSRSLKDSKRYKFYVEVDVAESIDEIRSDKDIKSFNKFLKQYYQSRKNSLSKIKELENSLERVETILNRTNFKEDQREILHQKYLFLFEEIGLKKSESIYLQRYVKEFRSQKMADDPSITFWRIRSAILYSRGIYDQKERIEIFKGLQGLLNGEVDTSNKQLVAFSRRLSEFKDYERKQFKSWKNISERSKQNSDFINPTMNSTLNEREIKNARLVAKELREQYENLWYGCKSNVKNVHTEARNRNFKLVMTLGTPIAAGTGYTLSTWNDEKDANWWKELTYRLTVGFALGYINSYPFSKIANWPLKFRWPITYAVVASEDFATSNLYVNFIRTENKEKIEDDISRIVSTPELREYFELYVNWLMTQGHENKEAITKLLNLNPDEELDISRVDKDELKNEVMMSYSDYLYQSNRGPVSMGHGQLSDVYSFNRLFDVANMTKEVLLLSTINHLLCTTKNPNLGLLYASTLFLTDRITTNFTYKHFLENSVFTQKSSEWESKIAQIRADIGVKDEEYRELSDDEILKILNFIYAVENIPLEKLKDI